MRYAKVYIDRNHKGETTPSSTGTVEPTPPPRHSKVNKTQLHVGDVTNTRPTAGSAKYPQLTPTHKNALSYHELTYAKVQGRLVSKYAGNDTVSERHRPETRQCGVEGGQ